MFLGAFWKVAPVLDFELGPERLNARFPSSNSEMLFLHCSRALSLALPLRRDVHGSSAFLSFSPTSPDWPLFGWAMCSYFSVQVTFSSSSCLLPFSTPLRSCHPCSLFRGKDDLPGKVYIYINDNCLREKTPHPMCMRGQPSRRGASEEHLHPTRSIPKRARTPN